MGPTPKPSFSSSKSKASVCFTFVFLLSASASGFAEQPASIYDHLRLNGLPMGLFPRGITDFSLDPTTGRFEINLTSPCNAKFETQLHYDFNVSGFLSLGKIANLSGVSQQELFLWFPVSCIRVDVPTSHLIYFDVGVLHKQFPLSLFENPKDCAHLDLHPPSSSSSSSSFKPGVEMDQVGMLRAAS